MTDVQAKFKFKKRSKESLKKKGLRRGAALTNATTNGDVVVVVGTENDDRVDGDRDVALDAAVGGETLSTDLIVPNPTTSAAVAAAPDDVGDEDDDEEDGDGDGAIDAILAAERRRKLLGSRNHRGVDASRLGRADATSTTGGRRRLGAVAMTTTDGEGGRMSEVDREANATTTTANNDADLDERLRGRTFAMGKLAGSNDMGGDDEGGILAKKHRRAMEEFIRKNLADGGGDVGGDDAIDVNASEGGDGAGAVVRASEAERELYAELLNPADDDGKGGAIDDMTKGGDEGDVGAGGAMMGGTGIAEVALPIDERLRALKATEKAAMEHERARRARYGDGGGRYGETSSSSSSSSSRASESKTIHPTSVSAMVPMNFASGPGKRKRRDSSSMRPAVEEDPSSRVSSVDIGIDYPVESSAMVGHGYHSSVVRKSDVSELGASYSHNFHLHTKEWLMRRRDERQNEIDAMQAQQEVDEGPTTAAGRARVGFDISRKLARGEVIPPSASASGGKGPNGEMRNEWDRKPGGDHRSSDERVWRTFMTNQRNRR
jgi:hypothetical protein